MHSLLVNHMLQFRYSAQGALRWKGDVTEYVEALRGWEVPGLRDKLQRVQVRVWRCAGRAGRILRPWLWFG